MSQKKSSKQNNLTTGYLILVIILLGFLLYILSTPNNNSSGTDNSNAGAAIPIGSGSYKSPGDIQGQAGNNMQNSATFSPNGLNSLNIGQ
jgi:hypothetical protein